MHPTRSLYGHLVGIAPSLDDLPPARSATEAAFLREPFAPGPSRPRLDVGLHAAIGAVIRTARARIGMAQPDFAKALEVSTNAVRDWESGREPIPAGRVEQIAKALGLAPQAIAAPEHIARDAEERELLVAFRKLTPVHRQSLLARLP